MMKSILVWLLATAILISAPAANAQQSGKIFRIGYLNNSTAVGSAVLVNVFRQELTNLGSIEGQSHAIEYRLAEQNTERLPDLAAELVRLKVDLIVVSGPTPALAAKNATSTVPIVMVTVGDPVGFGLVASPARPAGNITGLSSVAPELNTKRLEILKDAVPKLTGVGLLRLSGQGDRIAQDLQLKELTPAAVALKLKLKEIDAQLDPTGLESA